MKLRSNIAVYLAEFLGTAILATVAINVSRSQIGISYFVAIGVGLALAILVLGFGKISGAHVNPAVTFGLWTARKIGTLKAAGYVAAQLLGGVAAWQLANYFAGSEIPSLAPSEFEWTPLVAEIIGTFVFTFAVAAAVYQDLTDGQKAALIGGGLFAGVVVASLASNAVLNPAVAIANQSVSKAYMLGPVIGGIAGFNLYVLFFAPASALGLGAVSAKKSASTVEESSKPTTAKVVRATAKKPVAKKTATKKTTKTTSRKK
ncbi:aquaporin [Candidatus Saccharibacteria bacterium]|nr:aquaporin [Candidatus Saccharibacteria bacterium]